MYMHIYIYIYIYITCICMCIYIYIYIHTYIHRARRANSQFLATPRPCLWEHKPGRIKPGSIKRAALSLQHQNG